jgi:hypothetical protein
MITIRNYVKGEELPEALKTGFETGSMSEWIWVAERDGNIVAMLIAAPAHVVAILLRVLTTPEAGLNDLRTLLIRSLNDIKARGFPAYITWLNPERNNEKGLLGIIKASDGVQIDEPQVLCGGKI